MMIKVCGMTRPDNLEQVGSLGIDMVGFIFYPPSPRHVNGHLPPKTLSQAAAGKRKVGVFVNEKPGKIIETAHLYGLDAIQLHGDELPEDCDLLRPAYQVIKAFPIAGAGDFEATLAYEGVCDFFLFDTKGAKHGGNGTAFDWNLLKAYQGATPFLLSGGISADDALKIREIRHEKLAGVDLNSRFEDAPGVKNVALLKQFIANLM